MGNELSAVDYDGPPKVLKGRDIPSLAEYIKSKQCENVFLMVSAMIVDPIDVVVNAS